MGANSSRTDSPTILPTNQFGTNPSYEVFHPDGGGVIYKAPSPTTQVTATDYEFTVSNEVDGIGTTCGTAACTDLMIIAPDLTAETCRAINDLLQIGTVPVDDSIDIGTLYDGTTSYGGTIGDDTSSEALFSKTAGCLRDGSSGPYYFYQVLWAR